MAGSILNREDYKSAIPQLSAKLNEILDNNIVINRTVVNLTEGKVSDLNSYLGYFQSLTTGYFQAIAGDVQFLSSRQAYLGQLKADIAGFGYLTADSAVIENLQVGNLTIGGQTVNVWDKAVLAESTANDVADILDDMADAAQAAHTTLTQIYADAESAKTDATTARSAADSAMKGLGQVEDVVGTLDWITAHSKVTTDTTPQAGKSYYIKNQDNTFTLVTDVTGKNPSQEGWYELTEAVQNYILSHLALTNDGLYVMKDNSHWKVRIADDGVYIVDGNGDEVAKYKDAITLGVDDGSRSYVFEDYHSLQMFDKESAEVIANATEWDFQSTYEVGDIIKRESTFYGTRYYQCITEITTPAGWDESYWERLYPLPYLYISDLRNERGVAVLTEKSTIDSEEVDTVSVSYPMKNGECEVYVNGNSECVYQSWQDGRNVRIFTPTLHVGDVVTVVYLTEGGGSAYWPADALKAYSLGLRKKGSTIGRMSFAEGYYIDASGAHSHAEGYKTTASGNYSHAEGRETTASGDTSHAEGASTTASGTSSHAEGEGTTASGIYSHAEGRGSIASGACSHAEGGETTASGVDSHAEGYDAAAIGNYSHAQNIGTVAGHNAQTAIGKFNDNQTDTAFEIGNGSSDTNRSNAFEVDWNGNVLADGDIEDGQGNVLADKLDSNGIFDLIYPVGSYYWTSDGNFVPADVFGGSWEKIDAGVTLVSAGTGYTVTSGTAKDGGSEDSIIPYHRHSVAEQNTGNMSANSSHSHDFSYAQYQRGTGSATASALQYTGSTKTTSTESVQHTHKVPSHNTNYAGTSGNTTGANMPPYKCAYCWHRTA